MQKTNKILNMITDPDPDPDHPKGQTTDNQKPQDTFNWLINDMVNDVLAAGKNHNFLSVSRSMW